MWTAEHSSYLTRRAAGVFVPGLISPERFVVVTNTSAAIGTFRGTIIKSTAEPSGASLLLREHFAESRFGSVNEAEVAGPIDERVRRVLGLGAFTSLSVHIEHVRVRGQKDVSGQVPQHTEAPLEIRPDSGICFRLDQRHEREQREAADVDGKQLAAAVVDGERPRGAAARVAGGDVRGERERPKADRLAVFKPVVDTRRREAALPEKSGEKPERPKGGICGVSAGGHNLRITLADPQFGAGRFLQSTKSARVVGMRVRVEQHFHVGDVEAELRDARHDQRCAFGIAAVDQYVALGSGEQKRGNTGGADVVEVASDAERFIGRRAVSLDRRAPEQTEHHDKSGRCS